MICGCLLHSGEPFDPERKHKGYHRKRGACRKRVAPYRPPVDWGRVRREQSRRLDPIEAREIKGEGLSVGVEPSGVGYGLQVQPGATTVLVEEAEASN